LLDPAGIGRLIEQCNLLPFFISTGEPLLEYEAAKEGEHDRDSVIGLTAAGERVHAKTDDLGVSAVVQWSSPVE